MKNKFLLLVVALTALTLVFAGCQKDNSGNGLLLPTDEDANDSLYVSADDNLAVDIQGEILEIDSENGLKLLVDSNIEALTGQVWVTLDENTEYVNSEGKIFTPDDAATLFEVGEVASLVSNGTIMESYPMQTSAEKVFLDNADN